MFNSLICVKKLEEAGVSREQAEAHVQIISELIEMNLATKQDLAVLRSELRSDLAQLEQRLAIRMGSILSIGIGLAVALAKFIH